MNTSGKKIAIGGPKNKWNFLYSEKEREGQMCACILREASARNDAEMKGKL